MREEILKFVCPSCGNHTSVAIKSINVVYKDTVDVNSNTGGCTTTECEVIDEGTIASYICADCECDLPIPVTGDPDIDIFHWLRTRPENIDRLMEEV